ncbi:unnamed protein product [Closterium sp. NIES-65]|nr:unnamed protein product [Closterium sp. NIES-65]
MASALLARRATLASSYPRWRKCNIRVAKVATNCMLAVVALHRRHRQRQPRDCSRVQRRSLWGGEGGGDGSGRGTLRGGEGNGDGSGGGTPPLTTSAPAVLAAVPVASPFPVVAPSRHPLSRLFSCAATVAGGDERDGGRAWRDRQQHHRQQRDPASNTTASSTTTSRETPPAAPPLAERPRQQLHRQQRDPAGSNTAGRHPASSTTASRETPPATPLPVERPRQQLHRQQKDPAGRDPASSDTAGRDPASSATASRDPRKCRRVWRKKGGKGLRSQGAAVMGGEVKGGWLSGCGDLGVIKRGFAALGSPRPPLLVTLSPPSFVKGGYYEGFAMGGSPSTPRLIPLSPPSSYFSPFLSSLSLSPPPPHFL